MIEKPQAHRARRTEWLLWAGLLLFGTTLLLAFLLALLKGQARPLPVLGQVGDFTLTNQQGRAVSLADLRGQVWVADIIFTRCTGPCLKMTAEMARLQDSLPAANRASLVTLTTDPDFDTPKVLSARAGQFHADPARWLFLTGAKKQIKDLAVGSLKLTALPKEAAQQENPADLFIHSTIFVIVDKQARLRGTFETVGDNTDWRQTQNQILAAIKRLEREP